MRLRQRVFQLYVLDAPPRIHLKLIKFFILVFVISKKDCAQLVEEAVQNDPQVSARKVAGKNYSYSAVLRTFRRLGYKPFKQLGSSKLTPKQKAQRVEVCKKWLGMIETKKMSHENIFWSDEKLFKVKGTTKNASTQNCRVWIKNAKKKDLSAKTLLMGKSGGRFSKSYCMVAAGMSFRGAAPPFFSPKRFEVQL